MPSFIVWFGAHPDVDVASLYLLALGAHVAVGMALHAFRLHDFDWAKVGSFVEQDWAVARGIAIGTTFLMNVALAWGSQYTTLIAVYKGPAFVALVAACGASILPIGRDTLYELVQLVSGANVKPAVPVVVAAAGPIPQAPAKT